MFSIHLNIEFTKSLKSFFILTGFLLLCMVTHGQSITYFVKANATGANNGTSWTNAYTNLTSALIVAKGGDTIKVAKGTYVPQASYFGIRDSTILLGGYPNTGNPTNAERDWKINQTILTGSNIRANVVANSNFLSAYTQLNGFILEAGYNPSGATGAALRLANSNPVISNCVFRNNLASAGGSNISCDSSKPKFINCFFINGYDFSFGSIYCIKHSVIKTITIYCRCIKF